MFKRRATLDSTTQSRPNLPPPILPTQTPTVENSFSQNILKRIPSLHGTNSKSSRVKVPNSSNSSNDQFRPQAQAQPQQNISPSNSSINFARPSNDYSSHNNNNNGNYQQNYSNGNNNNNAAAVGGSSSYYNSLSRSTSTITTQSFQQAPPLHQHNQNSYTSNRNANQHRSSSQSIASLYPSSAYTTSPPPVPTIPSIPKSHSLPNIRKIHKLLTCYNLICIGSKSTGKTAFIKTLIRNLALVKSSHEKDALNRIEAFGNQKLLNSGAGKKSEIINLEIVTDAKEKINLSIVDTVGLDVQSGNSIGSIGHEMELERQLDALMRIIEDRFQDSLAAVSIFCFSSLLRCIIDLSYHVYRKMRLSVMPQQKFKIVISTCVYISFIPVLSLSDVPSILLLLFQHLVTHQNKCHHPLILPLFQLLQKLFQCHL